MKQTILLLTILNVKIQPRMKILHLNFHLMSFLTPIPLRAVKFWTLCDIQSSSQCCRAVCLWRLSSSDSRFYLFLAPVFTWKQALCVICTVPLLNKQWSRSRFYTSPRTKHLRWKEKKKSALHLYRCCDAPTGAVFNSLHSLTVAFRGIKPQLISREWLKNYSERLCFFLSFFVDPIHLTVVKTSSASNRAQRCEAGRLKTWNEKGEIKYAFTSMYN